ncbi:hypothetical protein COCNU_contig69220064G000010 [Cocos nucifera]|nr:hypothetical protein [Cocos nucifera]
MLKGATLRAFMEFLRKNWRGNWTQTKKENSACCKNEKSSRQAINEGDFLP